ncbi:complement C1q-like protein 4 [Engraulis encrasicolus]|uniref:complement C1q-like protein 4 n=1 Tax=Engraulis encrasicolus TaxID=184585 RepID=UPI002FD1D2A6
MKAAISLLVLLLSMCGVQTESHGTDFSTELKELRHMAVELRADNVAVKERLAASESKVEALEDENKAVKERLAASESKVEALERALQDTKTEMKTEVAANETAVEKEIRAAPKVAFSAGLGRGFTTAGSNHMDLVFSRVITNVGEAYSNTTGFFTSPVRGVYYFRFTVMDSVKSYRMGIRMHKNGEKLMWHSEYGTDEHNIYLSGGLTLQLEMGDTVNMALERGRRLYDDADNLCTFSGFLLFSL